MPISPLTQTQNQISPQKPAPLANIIRIGHPGMPVAFISLESGCVVDLETHMCVYSVGSFDVYFVAKLSTGL